MDEDSHEEVEAIVVVVEDFEVCPLHPAVASCALQESRSGHRGDLCYIQVCGTDACV